MFITYARSSGLNTLEFCAQQYFITYNLGLTKYNPPNRKTTIGTIVHKVMETLAICKYEFQTKSTDSITIQEEALGEISVSINDFLIQSKLTNNEVDDINKTRINKKVYKGNYFIKYGHVRYGRDFVNSLIKKAFEYYKHLHDDWEPVDFKTIVNFTWMALDYDNGRLDPRFQTIVEPEKHFNIPIMKDWAKYSYNIDGKIVEGYFSIKGTIDLLVEEDDGSLVINDYKTGQRLDLNTDPPEEKTFEKLCKDKQLMLYFYAAAQLFPEREKIKVRIFFVRDGGDFLIEFDRKKDIKKLEQILKDHFNEVRATEIPALISEDHSHMKCKYLCGYYKNKMPGTNECVCDFIHKEIKMNGIKHVVANYSEDKFSIGDYQEPGSK